VELTGRLGIVRRQGERVVAMWLLAGSRLVCGADTLSSDSTSYTGTIEAATRKTAGADADAFLTGAELPLGEALHGAWMIVTHGGGYTHGYEIDRVEERDGRRVVVLTADHGLVIEGETTREAYFPRRSFAGVNQFSLSTCAARVAD
jgi:hypothetical protein